MAWLIVIVMVVLRGYCYFFFNLPLREAFDRLYKCGCLKKTILQKVINYIAIS
ncbi:MAG: hypothetical protein IJ239_06270 [Eubacterium sp.]|nr:hypothetical protein [Eubacterium sp.]